MRTEAARSSNGLDMRENVKLLPAQKEHVQTMHLRSKSPRVGLSSHLQGEPTHGKCFEPLSNRRCVLVVCTRDFGSFPCAQDLKIGEAEDIKLVGL